MILKAIDHIIDTCLPAYAVFMETKGKAHNHLEHRVAIMNGNGTSFNHTMEILYNEGVSKVEKLRKKLKEYDNGIGN